MILNWKRIQPLLMLVGLLLLVFIPLQAQDAPVILSPDEVTTGSLSVNNLSDVYRFEAEAGTTASLSVISGTVSVGLLLTDDAGNELGEGIDNLVGIALDIGGSYFVTAFAITGAGDYDLTLALEGGSETDSEATEAVDAEPTEVVEVTEPATSGDFITSLDPSTDVLINNGMEVRLQWDAEVDLNLEVRDPLGNTLYFDSRTSPVGGTFGFDANGFCEVISAAPAETATWQPTFLPSGSYEILVFYRESCAATSPAVPFTLTVTVDGETLDPVEGVIQPPPSNTANSVYLSNFVVGTDGSATLNTGGAYPDTSLNQLSRPASELASIAVPVTRDVAIQGAIFEEQDLIAYTFSAEEGEVLSISMNAVSRNLDTLLQLVDPNGNLIAVNDDSNGTNSLLSNVRILQDGDYTVVATRYGKDIGGTEGEFELVISSSTAATESPAAALNLPPGDIEVFLTWATNHDLQLLVRDPVGQAVYDDEPSVTSGGLLASQGNVNCTVSEGDAVSYIYWPLGLARAGTYETEVWFQNSCDDTNIVEFTLTIVVNDEVVAVERQFPSIGDRFVISFTIGADGTASAGPGGFVSTGIAALDLVNEIASPIVSGTPINASITQDNAFDVYAFSGTANQTVTIFMQTTSQTLDTSLYLVDQNGILLTSNDDADESLITGADQRPTDSLISNFTLPATGEYRIIATRFGTIYGGTVGTYRLTLQTN